MDIRKALERLGFGNLGAIRHNLNAPFLYEHALFLEEGLVSAHGALVVSTAPQPDVAVEEVFIVEERADKEKISWNAFRKPIEAAKFGALKARMAGYLQGRDVYVQDGFAGNDPKYRLPVRVITEFAWQSLFARALLYVPERSELARFEPRLTLVCAPKFRASPEADGTRSEAFAATDFSQRLALVGGASYAGEIKRAVFSVLSYLLPSKRVFPISAMANVGAKGDTALFLGATGSGKTSLAQYDPDRKSVGDDEQGWADEGILALACGCYVKAAHAATEANPLTFQMARNFGTIVENVALDAADRSVHFAESTADDYARVTYSRNRLPKAPDGATLTRHKAAHPRHIFFLVEDAFGVLPLVAQLSVEQALFFFLNGYAGQVAKSGKEEAEPLFSPCFAAPLMTLAPSAYAMMFKHRLQKNKSRVWLVNTGWTGGAAENGRRSKLEHTRAIIAAALNGELENAAFAREPFFNVRIPAACAGVPAEMLQPRALWQKPAEYDAQARTLAEAMQRHFDAAFPDMEAAVREAISIQAAREDADSAEEKAEKTSQSADSAEERSMRANDAQPPKSGRRRGGAKKAAQPQEAIFEGDARGGDAEPIEDHIVSDADDEDGADGEDFDEANVEGAEGEDNSERRTQAPGGNRRGGKRSKTRGSRRPNKRGAPKREARE